MKSEFYYNGTCEFVAQALRETLNKEQKFLTPETARAFCV